MNAPQDMQHDSPVRASGEMFMGELTGVDFPGDIESFLAAGAAFLTCAFKATGILAADNQVVAIDEAVEFFGGGLGGQKLSLIVTYLCPAPHLTNHLFVKFQLPQDHPWHEKFAPVMEPEVRFALLSMRSDFPIHVPRCYFADYHPSTLSAILITERIAFGVDKIEPVHDKCTDSQLENPLEYYRALARALARLAAFQKTDGFGPQFERQFPFDVDAQCGIRLIRFDEAALRLKLKALRQFINEHPQLFENALRDPHFLDEFDRTAILVREHEGRITSHLSSQRDSIALCHWNLNLDNAWFWRNERQELDCGVLDWGGVAQMHIAHGFYGMESAAEPAFLAVHEKELMVYFLEQYHLNGGPVVDYIQFERSVRLATAVKGVAWMLDGFLAITADLAALRDVTQPRDPRIDGSFKLRCGLQMFLFLLSTWRRADMAGAIESVHK